MLKRIFGGGGRERESSTADNTPRAYVISLPSDGEFHTGRFANCDENGNLFTKETAAEYVRKKYPGQDGLECSIYPIPLTDELVQYAKTVKEEASGKI